jgi:hypothetical protein
MHRCKSEISNSNPEHNNAGVLNFSYGSPSNKSLAIRRRSVAALTTLRLLQRLGVGGEWGGVVVVAIKWKSLDSHRGLDGSWPQFGSPLGLLLVLLVLTVVRNREQGLV